MTAAAAARRIDEGQADLGNLDVVTIEMYSLILLGFRFEGHLIS